MRIVLVLATIIILHSYISLLSFALPFVSKSSTPKSSTLAMDDKTNKRLQIVLALHKNGKLDEAIEGYKVLIPLVPDQVKMSLFGNLGALLMGKGLYEEAKDQFQAAVQIAPGHASSQFNLAVLLTSKLNQHAKALKHCALAIRADPQSHKAHHLMGNILQNLGKHAEAEKYFEQAELLAGESKSTVEGAKAKVSSLAGLLRYSLRIGDRMEHIIEGRTYVIKCVSEAPLIFVIDDLISESDCDAIQGMADNLEKSFVMGGAAIDASNVYNLKNNHINSSGNAMDIVDEDPRLYRSSYTAWVPRNSLLESLQERLGQLLSIPLAYVRHKSEDLQVVKYNLGGQFKAHQDSSHYHPRLLTALVYLNTVTATPGATGGETWFPFAQHQAAGLAPPSTVEEAVVKALEVYEGSAVEELPGLAVEPRKGRAVVFFNCDLSSGQLDPLAVHAGLPVRLDSNSPEAVDNANKAKKWIANYWIESDPSLLADLLVDSKASESAIAV